MVAPCTVRHCPGPRSAESPRLTSTPCGTASPVPWSQVQRCVMAPERMEATVTEFPSPGATAVRPREEFSTLDHVAVERELPELVQGWLGVAVLARGAEDHRSVKVGGEHHRHRHVRRGVDREVQARRFRLVGHEGPGLVAIPRGRIGDHRDAGRSLGRLHGERKAAAGGVVEQRAPAPPASRPGRSSGLVGRRQHRLHGDRTVGAGGRSDSERRIQRGADGAVRVERPGLAPGRPLAWVAWSVRRRRRRLRP